MPQCHPPHKREAFYHATSPVSSCKWIHNCSSWAPEPNSQFLSTLCTAQPWSSVHPGSCPPQPTAPNIFSSSDLFLEELEGLIHLSIQFPHCASDTEVRRVRLYVVAHHTLYLTLYLSDDDCHFSCHSWGHTK